MIKDKKSRVEVLELFNTTLKSLNSELENLLLEDEDDIFSDLFLGDGDTDDLIDQAVLESRISMLEWVLDELYNME